ncbi:serine/threonine protein kinase [Candidatus Margulisiibacteriota bacterium]
MDRFLKSRYKIGKKIGEGPFSFTYEGFLIGTQVPVIIKVYKRAALNSPLINKLRPKVMRMIGIDHPLIAKILDGDYGWQGYYFVREFIDGDDLGELLSTEAFDVDTSVNIAKRVAEALHFAHDNDVIHGALSANNIFITRKKELKLVDFILEGKVRSNIDLLAHQTSFDSRYLSPEQIKGEEVSELSDIYSFGVVLYQLLTGTLPFNGDNNLEIAIKHLTERPQAPSTLNPNVPEYLDEIVLKCLEKDPVMRFKRIGEIEESLKEKALIFKGAEVDLSNLIYDDMEAIDPGISQAEEPQKKAKKPARRKPNVFMWILFFILIAIASGLWYSFIQGLISTR